MKKKELQHPTVDEIVRGIRSGDRRLLARGISLTENEEPAADQIARKLFRYTGNAYRIGITGPPGAGKSTLTSGLASQFRQQGKTVGIVAVDPTSPFSGGAVLGDRIRMSDLSGDPGVFIRSMATRGSLGGLAKTAQEVADLLDAAGMDVVILETVGVGQGEIDVARATDTTLVVLVPESGDSIQAMKAGLMEIADVFVINKSDREGATKLKIELEQMLNLRVSRREWIPPILQTVATSGTGIEELARRIQDHWDYLVQNKELNRKRSRRLREKVEQMIIAELGRQFWNNERRELFEEKIREVIERQLPPHALVQELFAENKSR